MLGRVAIVLLCCVAVAHAAAFEAVQVTTYGGGNAKQSGYNAKLCVRFSVVSAITVESLGVWDDAGDGLAGPAFVSVPVASRDALNHSLTGGRRAWPSTMTCSTAAATSSPAVRARPARGPSSAC